MATVPELSAGKVYIGPEPRQDRSVKTIESGEKQFDGTLAVTGLAFIGGHSETASGVLNIGTNLGNFSPEIAGRALDVEGDVNIVGQKATNAVYIQGDLYVSGKIDGDNKGRLKSRFSTADSLPAKPFDIGHPSKEGWRLRHVSLEGPESAVFYRGRLTGSNTIELPYYWKDLVHEDSITVSIQPIGSTQKIIVMEFDNEKIILSGNTDCFFHVYGERKDVNPLLTEYEGKDRYDYPDPNFNENSELSVEGRNYTDPNYEFPRNTITT
tara:strand:+ start:4561 stop:5364 length:804 start_codon:yes stop_codon:yes gene_type:complete